MAKKKAVKKRKPDARKKPAAGKKPASAKKGAQKKAKPGKPRKLDKRLAAVRDMLLDRRGVLLKELDQDYREMKDRGEGRYADVSDMATEIADGELALQVAQNESGEIAQINEALAKIEEGTYGTCESCRKKIPAQRLQLLPFATLCVVCKEAEERGTSKTDADGILAEIEFADEVEEE